MALADDGPAVVNTLLVALSFEQARLLEVVYGGRMAAGYPNYRHADSYGFAEMRRVGKPGAWPIFQYVEAVLAREHQLDARTVLAECPSVAIAGSIGSYGWVRLRDPRILRPEDEVALTVAGMSRTSGASDEVDVFLEVLAFLIERERDFAPSPTTVQNVEVHAGELKNHLERDDARWSAGLAELASIHAILGTEPSTWHCQLTSPDASGAWAVTPSPFVRNYAGVDTPEEYVERLVEAIAPPCSGPAPLHDSSLSLPEAIDYLNVVWRVHAGKPLLRLARVEAAAKLALECANADELESRLSAFCGILGDLQLPGSEGNRKLSDLSDYLDTTLPPEGADRARAAVDDLRAFFDIRAWRQHAGSRAEKQGRRGMQRLGVQLPTADWQGAWLHLQARAVAGLCALREEIETLDDSDELPTSQARQDTPAKT